MSGGTKGTMLSLVLPVMKEGKCQLVRCKPIWCYEAQISGVDMILGYPFLKAFRMMVNCPKDCLVTHRTSHPSQPFCVRECSANKVLTTTLLPKEHSVRNALDDFQPYAALKGGLDDLHVAQLKAAGQREGLSVSNPRFVSPGCKVTPWETDHLAVDGSYLDASQQTNSHSLAEVGNEVYCTTSTLQRDRSLPSVCESTALVEPQRAKFYCLCCGKKFEDKDLFSYDCCQERSIQRIRTHHLQESSPEQALPEDTYGEKTSLVRPVTSNVEMSEDSEPETVGYDSQGQNEVDTQLRDYVHAMDPDFMSLEEKVMRRTHTNDLDEVVDIFETRFGARKATPLDKKECRKVRKSGEYTLDPAFVEDVLKIAQSQDIVPTVDAFASERFHIMDRYWTKGSNAFKKNWVGEVLWLHPLRSCWTK